MKKGSKLAALLLGLVLVIPACNLGGNASNGASSDAAASESALPAANYAVTISNKEQLQAEWFVGDQSRKVEIATEPKANVAQLIKDGAIQITSSNPEILSINGQMATPVAAGEATIKVKCGESEDTVALTLQAQQTVQEKYGVAHAGTAEDPLTNEEAIKVAKHEKYSNEDLYVGGIISSFYHAPLSRTDGACSYYLTPAEGQTEKFEVYKCYKDGTGEASYLTDDDIWVGGYAIAHGTFTVYNGTQAETTSAKFVKCEGNKPQPSTTIEATFAEALAAGAALVDGATTWDSYKFQGYVSAKSGNHFFLTATKGEALVEATSDAAHGSASYYSNAIELYNAGKVAELVAKLLEGAKVEVTMKIKNYHGTVENGYDLTDESVTVIEAGTAWSVPEPAVTDKTIAEFIALENKADKAYNVSGTIKSWKDASSAKDKYGNMVLTDGTNDLTIYGASATATALAWDNAGSYAFSNPQDFLTNELTASLAIGSEITMRLIRADYKGAIRGTGVVTGVKAVEATAIALDKQTAEVEIGSAVTLTATLTPANSNSPITWLSSDDTIATVENGLVTGVAAGTATITAKVSETIKAECVVTVKAPSVVLESKGSLSYNKDATVVIDNQLSSETDKKITYTSTNGLAITVKKGSSSSEVNVWKADYSSCRWYVKHVVTFASAKAFSRIALTCDSGYADFKAEAEGTTIAAIKAAGGTVAYEGTKIVINLASAVTSFELIPDKQIRPSFVEIFGEAGSVDPQPEIAQPTGTFFASAEITDTGKAALGTTNGIVPIFITLGADNAVSVSVNGNAIPATLKSYDKTNGNLVITTTSFGDLSMTYNPETGYLENLSVVAATGVLKYDGGQALRGNDKIKYWNCDGSTEELQAQWNRRYGNPWTIDTVNADKITQNTEHAISGSALRLRPYASDRCSLATKDFAEPFNCRNISFWVYNSGESSMTIQCFGYTKTGYSTDGMINPFGNKSIPAGQWTYISVGFTASNLYGFQIFVAAGSGALIFDDIVLF